MSMPKNRFVKEVKFIGEHKLETPVAFFSEKNMLEAYDVMERALSVTHEVYYAVKSCYHPPLLKAISRLGAGAEVLSELELELAQNNGFTKFIINGMGRSQDFLKRAAELDDACIIVDSHQDLRFLETICEQSMKPVRLGVRLDIKLPGHAVNTYLSQEHKLGNRFDSPLFQEFLRFCKQHANAQWDILHMHVTINETDPQVYEDAIAALHGYADDLVRQGYAIPSRIDIGGGFEVYDPKQQKVFQALFGGIARAFAMHFEGNMLVVEPGRYLSAYSGYTIGRVTDVKSAGDKQWVITDIGTNTLIPIPNARYKLLLPVAVSKGVRVGIADGITSPANTIIADTQVAVLPKSGDIVCVGNTGAYTDVYSTFWAYTPHQVCFIDKAGRISVYRSAKDIASLRHILFAI